MGIKSIAIKGFQSHKETILDLSPGLNVIYGNTDSGKSSVFRAIQFALTNQLTRIPNEDEKRDDYLNWDLKDGEAASIGIEFEDGSYVIREKSPNGKINQYVISSSKEPLKALRGKLPEEVFAITGMNESNLQSQIDSYFLIDQSSGQVSKEFNKLANLEITDVLTSDLKSSLTSMNRKVDECDAEIESLSEELKSYELVGIARKELTAITQTSEKIEQLQEETGNILSVLIEIDEVKTNLKAFRDVPSSLSDIRQLEKQSGEINGLIDNREILFRRTVELGQTLSRIEQYQTLEPALKELKTLIVLQNNIEIRTKGRYTVSEIRKETVETKELLIICLKENVKLMEEEERIAKQYKICPTCKTILGRK